MGTLFARPAAPHAGGVSVSAHDRAVLDLKVQRDKLRKFQKQMESALETDKEMARRALRDNKKAMAKCLLARRKYRQGLLEKTEGQILELEEMVGTIEFSLIQQKVLDGLKTGNDTLKEIQSQMTVEDAERIMADTQDAKDYLNEIDAILATKLSPDEDAAIVEELEALVAAQVAAQMPAVPADEPLPTEPTEEQQDEVESTQQQQQRQQREAEPVLVAA